MNKIYEYLTSKGYEVKEVTRPAGTFYITHCPKCGEKDFAVNSKTGSFNCVHLAKCGIKGSFKNLRLLLGDPVYEIKTPEIQYKEVTTKIDKPNKAVGDFLKKRGFKEEIYRQFKDILGYYNNAIAFLYKKDGEIVSIKYRSLTEKEFWKEKNTPPLLYNHDMCKGKEDLFIVEGELDVIAAFHYGIYAVSVPLGASDTSWINYNWDYINSFKRIFFMFDNDEAGQKNVYAIAKRIGEHKCYNVLLPYKDMNECLINNVKENDIIQVILDAEEFKHPLISNLNSFYDKVIESTQYVEKEKGIPTVFTQLTDILGGWRDGEVTIWTGSNGSGKSTIILQHAVDLWDKNIKVLIGSFEMPPKRYIKWMIQMEYGCLTEEAIKSFFKKHAEQIYIINRVGHISVEDISSTIEYACKRYGVQHVVIDSLMRIRLSSSDMYREQSYFMDDLCGLAQRYDIHIHLVAHPRKGEHDAEEPDKVDIAGSVDIINSAHNIIVVYRVESDSGKVLKKFNFKGICDCILSVKKNREFGKHGRVFLLFDENRRKFYSAE